MTTSVKGEDPLKGRKKGAWTLAEVGITPMVEGLVKGEDRLEEIARIIAGEGSRVMWSVAEHQADIDRVNPPADKIEDRQRLANYRFEQLATARSELLAKARQIAAIPCKGVEGWREIESAPKDGSDFVARFEAPDGFVWFDIMRWRDGDHMWLGHGNSWNPRREREDACMWSPLPAAPVSPAPLMEGQADD